MIMILNLTTEVCYAYFVIHLYLSSIFCNIFVLKLYCSAEGRDLSQMNLLAQGHWKNMVAVVLLKPLITPFSKLLMSYLPSAMHVVCGKLAVQSLTSGDI